MTPDRTLTTLDALLEAGLPLAEIERDALEAVGRYDGAVIAGLRAAGVATLAAVPALVWWASRRRRRARA